MSDLFYVSNNNTLDNLIESGSVAITGTIDLSSTGKYNINANAGKLILSSSVGSYVEISGGLGFDNGGVPAHLVERTGHLILSSSVGSMVALSGNLLALSSAYIRGTSINDINLSVVSNGVLNVNKGNESLAAGTVSAATYRDNGASFNLTTDKIELRSSGKISWDKNAAGVAGSNDEFQLVSGRGFLPAGTSASGTFGLSSSLANTVVNGMTLASLRGSLILSSSETSIVSVSGALDLNQSNQNYHVRAVNSNLVLSSSAGSIVALSASEDYMNTDKAYHIRAVNSPLILSSSVGSVVQVSGALLLAGTYTSSTLPTAPPTGSIVYVSDLGFAAIYVNSTNKYLRISSGAF